MGRIFFLIICAVSASIMAGTPCYRSYQSGKNYLCNALVSLNGKNYQAQWGTQNVPGTSSSGWKECEECDNNEPLEFQAAWPPFQPAIGGLPGGTKVSYNGRNYIAAYQTPELPTNLNFWSDAGPCNPPVSGELGFFRVSDSRKYASCQNYADGGKFYEFRISQDGKLHFWIDNVYQGIFAFDPQYNNSAGTHFETSAAGTKFQLPPLKMVAADNNRIIVKARDSQKTYWTCLVDEYPHDFILQSINPPQAPVSASLPGHFTVVNPEYGKTGYTPPTFPTYPFVHFGTTNFYNPLPLTNDGLKDLFGPGFVLQTATFDGMPDLADIVRKNTTRLFEDAMGVAVKARHFYEIGAKPPRNAVSDQLSSMTDARYKEIVYNVWAESFSALLGVLKDEILVPNQARLKSTIVDKLWDAYNHPPQEANLTQYIWDHELSWWQRGALDFATGGHAWNMIDAGIRDVIDGLTVVINNLDMVAYAEIIDDMHMDFLEMMRDVGYDDSRFNGILSNVAGEVVAHLVPEISWGSSGNDDIDGIVNTVLETMRQELINKLVSGAQLVGSMAMKMDSENQADPNSATYWVKMYANSWHNYFVNLKAPGTYFGLKNTQPYPNQPGWNKLDIDILEIYDVGVGNHHRYEHARKHNGGELQNFFKEFTVEEYRTTTLTDGSDWTSFVDGNGFNDGTCNFYMLAKVRVASDGSNVPNQENIAVLWCDEQEYFSERWRVAHPLDASFEGFTGNLLNMFPVLAWEDGTNMPDFVRSYWAPFMQPGLIDETSRLANSRYGVVVSGTQELYTTAFFWATSDSTWRSRRYPNLNTGDGEYLDRSSVQIRDDQTIFMAGRKRINGKLTDGYFYQRLVPASNIQDSRPVQGAGVYGAKPAQSDYAWRFVEKAPFEQTDRDFFRMGVYNSTKDPIPEDAMGYDVYNNRGYSPRVHVLRCQDNIAVPDGTQLQLMEKDGTPYIHPMYLPAYDWDNLVTKPVDTYITVPKVCMKAVQVPFLNHAKTYLVFSDRRNDDIGAFLVNENTPNIDVQDYTYDLKFGANNVSRISSGNDDAGINMVTDLNVWSDASLGEIQFADNAVAADVTDQTFAGAEATLQNQAVPDLAPARYSGKTYVRCSFAMPVNPGYFHDTQRDIPERNMARYIFKAVNIGIIDPVTGTKAVVATFSVANLNVDNPDNAVCYGWAELTQTKWQEIRTKYLTKSGLATYATSVWADDYFGNGNTFNLTNDEPVNDGGATTVITGSGTLDITTTNQTFVYANNSYLHGMMFTIRNVGLDDAVTLKWYGVLDQNYSNCADRTANLNGNGAQINNICTPRDGNGTMTFQLKATKACKVYIEVFDWRNGPGCN